MQRLIDPQLPVLVVDNEEPFLRSVSMTLRLAGVTNVETCSDSRLISSILGRDRYSVVLLDLLMPYVSGWDIIPLIAEISPEVPIVVITASDDIDSAVGCIKAGAFHYLLKPFDKRRLLETLSDALEHWGVLREQLRVSSGEHDHGLKRPELFSSLITGDQRMQSLFQYVESVAPTPFPVLVTGETGTGKELMAHAIHRASNRAGELVAVNIAGLDDTLLSDTLFGHRRGAFTGADHDRKGMISRAENGTLFLDEIGDLSIESQIRLLRLIQEGVYFPLGSDEPVSTTARIVFATNHDLEAKTESGRFRKDLYYRLQSHHIHIPPLRERPRDIPLLIDHFVARAAAFVGLAKQPVVPSELYELIKIYDFPGNIRELEGLINDTVVRHKGGPLTLDRFRMQVFHRLSDGAAANQGAVESTPILPGGAAAVSLDFESFQEIPTIREAEDRLISLALDRANGVQTRAAAMLGISRQALYARLRRREFQRRPTEVTAR